MHDFQGINYAFPVNFDSHFTLGNTHLKHFLRGVFFFQKQLKLLTCYVQHTKLVETEKEISHRFKLKREKKSRAKKMKTLEYKAALRNCNTYMLSPIGVW